MVKTCQRNFFAPKDIAFGTRASYQRKPLFSRDFAAAKFGIAKSTASIWCRDIVLSAKIKKDIRDRWLIKTQPARLAGAQANKNKKLQSVEKAKLEAKKILASQTFPRDLLVGSICLYWAEGSKSLRTTGLLFVNSDPDMIVIIMNFFIKVFGCAPEDFICSVQINESHKPRIKTVLNFWQNLLQLPASQFRKPTYISTPHRRKYTNHDSYFGIMRLSVRRSTYLKYCMLELIKIFALQIMSE